MIVVGGVGERLNTISEVLRVVLCHWRSVVPTDRSPSKMARRLPLLGLFILATSASNLWASEESAEKKTPEQRTVTTYPIRKIAEEIDIDGDLDEAAG